MKRTTLIIISLVLLLTACVPASTGNRPGEEGDLPSRLTWVHGFYAISSYNQLSLTDQMDGVSLGWGRMFIDEGGTPYVNSAAEGGNLWVKPEGAQGVLDYLRERGKAAHLCVFSSVSAKYGDTNVLSYIIRPEVRETTVEVLVTAAGDYDGLTIDFEGLGSAGREDFSAFMALLRERLPAEKGLWVAVPPDNWYRGYDYRAIGAAADRVILMAHDYQWTSINEDRLAAGVTDTPLAPIGQVAYALGRITDPRTGVEDPDKVALAISFGSCGVVVDEEEDRLADTRLVSPGGGTLSKRLAQEDAEPGWAEEYASPYVFYHDENGVRYKVWYENADSVREKIRAAYACRVTGLSLWRLGAIPTYENYDVWAAILEEAGR